MLATAVANTVGATPPAPPQDHEALKRLASLKTQMVEAHPDKGGSEAAFIRARDRYLDVKRSVELGRRLGIMVRGRNKVPIVSVGRH
jgi:hypothetical protein